MDSRRDDAASPQNARAFLPIDTRVAPDPAVQLLTFSNRSALFHEVRQQVFELNETALAIWTRFADGQTLGGVTADLIASGVERDVAAHYVDIALCDWLDQGWLIPERVQTLLQGEPKGHLSVSLNDRGYDIRFFGADVPRRALAPFLHLIDTRPAQNALSVIASDEQYYLHCDGHSRGRCNELTLAPALKALLTEQLVNQNGDGFFAHGALVGLNGVLFFLSGRPGAGKSTLAASLLADGFEIYTDDIVHVDAGAMRGIPFATALKTGSWPLLAEQLPPLGERSVFRRADNQDVVYVQQATALADHKPIHAFILLERDSAATEPSLDGMTALDALKILLDSGFSSARAISSAQILSVARGLDRSACYVLRYAEADTAGGMLRALAER